MSISRCLRFRRRRGVVLIRIAHPMSGRGVVELETYMKLKFTNAMLNALIHKKKKYFFALLEHEMIIATKYNLIMHKRQTHGHCVYLSQR